MLSGQAPAGYGRVLKTGYTFKEKPVQRCAGFFTGASGIHLLASQHAPHHFCSFRIFTSAACIGSQKKAKNITMDTDFQLN